MKANADQTLHTRPATIVVGDKVLVKQKKRNAFSTPFDPKPYTVTWQKGNSIVASRGDHTIRRNVSFFKKVVVDDNAEYSSDEEFDDADIVAVPGDRDPVQDQARPRDPPEDQR